MGRRREEGRWRAWGREHPCPSAGVGAWICGHLRHLTRPARARRRAGTGKTVTLVEAVQQLRRHTAEGFRVLVAAPSNTAADHFVELLRDVPPSEMLRVMAYNRDPRDVSPQARAGARHTHPIPPALPCKSACSHTCPRSSCRFGCCRERINPRPLPTPPRPDPSLPCAARIASRVPAPREAGASQAGTAHWHVPRGRGPATPAVLDAEVGQRPDGRQRYNRTTGVAPPPARARPPPPPPPPNRGRPAPRTAGGGGPAEARR